MVMFLVKSTEVHQGWEPRLLTKATREFAFLTAALTALAILWLGGSAHAGLTMESYIPPEIVYADNLSQNVKLAPRGQKRDINHLSLNQLRMLPGFDENLALKVLRSRPFEDVQDFYRLPGLSKQEIDRLIDQIQPLIIFK